VKPPNSHHLARCCLPLTPLMYTHTHTRARARSRATSSTRYKLKLIDKSGQRFQQLVTQMRWRLDEGDGRAVYHVGVTDSGKMLGVSREEFAESTRTLKRMAFANHAEAFVEETWDGPEGRGGKVVCCTLCKVALFCAICCDWCPASWTVMSLLHTLLWHWLACRTGCIMSADTTCDDVITRLRCLPQVAHRA
jgi:hypothetical protein